MRNDTYMIRFFLASLLVVLFSLTSHNASAAPADKASEFITALGNDAIAIMSNKALSKEAKQTKIEAIFAENVDFEWVAKFAMGRFWRQATDEQKKRYVEAYKNFLIKHYTARFSDYTSGSFKVLNAKETSKGEFVIGMEIMSDEKNATPVLIDYKLRTDKNSFKVFDIIVEGVSMITTQRSEFASVLNKNGIDGLISQLQNKTLKPAAK